MSNTLPKSWEFTQLKYICDIQGGFAFKSKDYQDEGIPLLRISNIKEERVSFKKNTVYLDKSFIKNNEDFILNKGDIVIALSGATTGKYGKFTINDAALLNQRVGRIRFKNDELINYDYIYYYLGIIRNSILKEAYGAAQPNISTLELADFKIPLAPLPEQHRIVAKIEELFTKLDAGVESLKQVQTQLKRYRQSVLKAAVEGRLTAEWREQHKDELEPTDKLLERIQKEKKANLGKKYKEPIPVDTSDLPELPDTWSWVTIDHISFLISGQHIITKNYNQEGKGLPYLTGPADFGTKFPMTSKWTEFPKAISIKDDVLITVKGAGVGKTNILNLDESAISRQLMAIRSDYVKPDFMFYYFQLTFDHFQRIGQGSTVPGIDRETILSTPLPFPPLCEQMQIVIEIDKFLSIIEESEIIIKSELNRAQSLRQSILMRAFEGKLVPQDPNDLPASVLLERIKAEKAKSKKSKQMEMF